MFFKKELKLPLAEAEVRFLKQESMTCPVTANIFFLEPPRKEEVASSVISGTVLAMSII